MQKDSMIEIKLNDYWTLFDTKDIYFVNAEPLEAKQFKLTFFLRRQGTVTIERKFTEEETRKILDDVLKTKNPPRIAARRESRWEAFKYALGIK